MHDALQVSIIFFLMQTSCNKIDPMFGIFVGQMFRFNVSYLASMLRNGIFIIHMRWLLGKEIASEYLE